MRVVPLIARFLIRLFDFRRKPSAEAAERAFDRAVSQFHAQ